MCGRYAFILPKEAMRQLFKLLNEIDYPPRYNIAPTQPIIAIWNAPKGREAQLVRWGFMPSWVKDPNDFPLIINARVEGITSKPAFRGPIRHQRCIVPASGYFEWHRRADGSKQPYYITFEDDRPMAFAGLYSTWEGPDGEEVDTAAIVTQEATDELADIHNRTPVALTEAQYDLWLDTKNVDAKEALSVVIPLAALGVKSAPVARRVGSVKNDDPGLIEAIDLEAADDKPAPPPKKKASGQGELF